MKTIDNNLIVALDIGTSKIVAMVAECLPDGQLEIIGIGNQPSRGLKKGLVVNVDATVQSVQRAIEEAEMMAGCQINSVYTGISGSHIQSLNSHGFVAIKGGVVTEEDVARVIEAAKSVALSPEQKILHVLPQEYKVDLQEGIVDPRGMSGTRLECKLHLVTGAVTAAQNIVNCIRRCGIEVQDIILQPLASSYAVLTEDEKQLGVCMVDIGGGTTDIAVYSDGAIRHTAVIPVAGDQVTNDLAVVFKTPHHNAESIKIKHGCAFKELADKTEFFNVPTVGQKSELQLSQAELVKVIEPRYEELFALVLEQLQQSGWDGLLGAGIVLTGGSAQMPGVLELAEYIFQTHVRLGVPRYTVGIPEVNTNPTYATVTGLLLYGQQMQSLAGAEPQSKARPRVSVKDNLSNVIVSVKTWFQGNF